MMNDALKSVHCIMNLTPKTLIINYTTTRSMQPVSGHCMVDVNTRTPVRNALLRPIVHSDQRCRLPAAFLSLYAHLSSVPQNPRGQIIAPLARLYIS